MTVPTPVLLLQPLGDRCFASSTSRREAAVDRRAVTETLGVPAVRRLHVGMADRTPAKSCPPGTAGLPGAVTHQDVVTTKIGIGWSLTGLVAKAPVKTPVFAPSAWLALCAVNSRAPVSFRRTSAEDPATWPDVIDVLAE
jgi:hypothetical protein